MTAFRTNVHYVETNDGVKLYGDIRTKAIYCIYAFAGPDKCNFAHPEEVFKPVFVL